jgi:Helix-hairpin-helix motif
MRADRISIMIMLVGIWSNIGYSQDSGMPAYHSAQLEALAEKKDGDPTDDSDELDLESFISHPLNLNMAREEDLIQLHMLQSMQIKNFLIYRNLLGPLLSVHELQAVPGFDVETIRKLLPYIVVGRDESLYSALRERWKGGDESFLVRSARVLEKSKGFEAPSDSGKSYYEGSAMKVFIRYTYNYKNLLAFGFTGEKDAGEPFFRGAQRYGFDFYSFHFFLQHAGIVRALAIGDFTVNMGQGLIQWQSIAFTKSAQTLAIKREASCLKPYHSAGEFNFHRGLGISLQKGRWETSLFISSQKISTNPESDSSGRHDLFSSFQHGGYHRTPAEIADRNNSQQFSAGMNLRYNSNRFMLGVNWIHFQFNRFFKKREELYNLYSLRGTHLSDFSLDYGYTRANLHLFGELAVDQWKHFAFLQGALISLRENLDMSFLYRNISPGFQSLYSDAFTENSFPNNEKGLYAGLVFRPAAGIQMNLYYDVFIFPWLKYRIDAPSAGRDLLVQVNYQPDKSWRFNAIYKNERKELNELITGAGTHRVFQPIVQRWRIEMDYSLHRSLDFTGRMEFVRMDTSSFVQPRLGFLGVAGLHFRQSRMSGNISVTVFETDGYDTRVYLYEADLPYSFSLPAFYGRGIHYNLNLYNDISRLVPFRARHFHLSAGLNWGQTFYPGISVIGSGLDQISGNRRTLIKAQLLAHWQ